MKLSKSLIGLCDLSRYFDSVLGNGTLFPSFNLRGWPAFENSILLFPIGMRISSFGFNMFVYICGKHESGGKEEPRSLTRAWDEIGVLIA